MPTPKYREVLINGLNHSISGLEAFRAGRMDLATSGRVSSGGGLSVDAAPTAADPTTKFTSPEYVSNLQFIQEILRTLPNRDDLSEVQPGVIVDVLSSLRNGQTGSSRYVILPSSAPRVKVTCLGEFVPASHRIVTGWLQRGPYSDERFILHSLDEPC